jgi:uncharacterized membrane protein
VLGLAFATFSRYNTLYFWAICVCAVGCIMFAGGFLDLFYKLYIPDNSTIYRPLVVLTIGWYGMVTGFALVMYSRLYIVNVPKKYIQMMKYFIIYNVIFSHFPTTVLTFGANVVKTEEWVNGYAAMEKLQMTMFCIQEVLLGAMYLHYTRNMRLNKKITALVRQTLYINIAVLCLDFSMLFIEYIGLYDYQIMLKVVVYSIKLKMEFLILNILVRSLRQNAGTNDTSKGAPFSSGVADHLSARAGKEVAPALFLETQDSKVEKAPLSEVQSASASAKGDDC